MNASLAAMLRRLDDPNFIHANEAFSESLARLHFAVEHRHSLAVLLGPSGAGKTTLLRRFRRELIASPTCVVQVQLAGLEEAELRAMLAEQLGARQPSWRSLVDRLTELGYDKTPLVILADSAHNVPMSTLDFLSRLWDADVSGQLRISMVLAADEFAIAHLPMPWLQRVDLRVELERWSREDVAQFLDGAVGDERLRQRGFEAAAVQRIHEVSEGLPRLTRRLAQLSLLATEGQQHLIVDEATVTGVSHELCRVVPTPNFDGPGVEFVEEVYEPRAL